jgi:hypothetical protein
MIFRVMITESTESNFNLNLTRNLSVLRVGASQSESSILLVDTRLQLEVERPTGTVTASALVVA